MLNKQTKTLEDKQMHLLNENRGIANYACSSKSKKVKPSEQKSKKRGMEKRSDDERENKKQKVKKCKICDKKH